MSTTRVAVVTGANKGIGYAIVKALCKQFNGDVYLTSRNAQLGQAAVEQLKSEQLNVKYHQLDIDDNESIKTLKTFLENEYGGLDVLVNNAAIAYPFNSKEPTITQAENTIRVNFFALRNVCVQLFPLLRAHARVVNVTSSLGLLARIPGEQVRQRLSSKSLTEEQLLAIANEFLSDVRSGQHLSKGWPNSMYSVSKSFVTLLSFIQQRDFDNFPEKDIIVNAAHPGFVDTDLTNHRGFLTPDEGAESSVYAATLPANIEEPRGQMIWSDKRTVNWYTDNLTDQRK